MKSLIPILFLAAEAFATPYGGTASSYLNYYTREVQDNSLEYLGTVTQASFDRETRHLIADWTLSPIGTPAKLPYPEWMLEPFSLHTDVTFPAWFEDYASAPEGFSNDFPIAFSGSFSDGEAFGSKYACCAHNHISPNWQEISIAGYTGIKKDGYDLEIGTYLDVREGPQSAAESFLVETPEPGAGMLLLIASLRAFRFRRTRP